MRAVWLLLQTSAANQKNRRNIGVIPVLIIVMISTFCYVRNSEPENTESGKIALGVAKEDSSEYADLLLQYFHENEDFLRYVEIIEAKEQELEAALTEAALDAYLVIPENFAQSLIHMENLPIRARVSMKNPTKALVLRHVMEAYEAYIEAVEVNCTALYRCMKEAGFSSGELNNANVEISLELVFTALGKDDFFRKRVIETEEPETLSMAEHYRYTMVYFVLLFLFIPAGLKMLDVRKNNLTGRLKSVNIPMGAVLAAIGVPYMLLSILLLGLVCGLEQNFDRLLPAWLLVLPWLFVFLVLGQVCKDSRQYLFVCSMLLVCLAVLGGGLIPEEFLPDSFRVVAGWMPNRSFTHVMGGVRL